MSSFPVRRKADRPSAPVDIANAIRILGLDARRSQAKLERPSDRGLDPDRATRRENPG
jgi:hypothetical protein